MMTTMTTKMTMTMALLPFSLTVPSQLSSFFLQCTLRLVRLYHLLILLLLRAVCGGGGGSGGGGYSQHESGGPGYSPFRNLVL
jgi:hypothetical protein